MKRLIIYSKSNNCTVVGSSDKGISSSSGGSINTFVTNCIIWGNVNDLENCSATFSCIKDNDTGIGVFHTDPSFVDATDYNNVHLNSESLCIDAGAPWSDYSQEPDYPEGKIDIGAYGNTPEATIGGDIDGDKISDAWQKHHWPGYDPNNPDPCYGPDGNPDADDFNNWVEYLYGYDPTFSESNPMEIVVDESGPLSSSVVRTTIIDPTQGDILPISYMTNMAGDVNVSFKNTDTNEIVRTINRTSIPAGWYYDSWDGTDESNNYVERYLYTVVIDVNDGDGNSDNWSSKTGQSNPPDPDRYHDYSADFSSFDPYSNSPVVIRYKVHDWCKGKVDIVVPGKWEEWYGQNPNKLRVCHLAEGLMKPEPEWNTFYWYGRWGRDVNVTGAVYTEDVNVYFFAATPVKTGAVAVYYDYVGPLSNLRCNPYRILPLNDEVTTITYDLACDSNVTIDTYDPNGSYFGTLSEHQQAGPQEVIWYGTTEEPNDPCSRYISAEGVYRIEIGTDKTNEKLDGSITVYKYK